MTPPTLPTEVVAVVGVVVGSDTLSNPGAGRPHDAYRAPVNTCTTFGGGGSTSLREVEEAKFPPKFAAVVVVIVVTTGIRSSVAEIV